MATSKNRMEGNFKVKVNVNFTITLFEFAEMVDHVNTKVTQLPKGTNDIPDRWYCRFVKVGDILNIGENLVMDKRTGHVECYPHEVYERYSNQNAHIPGETRGNTQRRYAEALALLPPDLKDQLISRKEIYQAGSIKKPMLELIE